MQVLTFKRFLEVYVRSLSKSNTCNIKKLSDEIPDNHRLIEPLYLYAVSVNKTDYLLSLVKGQTVYSEYLVLSQEYSYDSLLSALDNKFSDIGEGYHKVYNSYLRRRDSNKTDNETKETLHKRIRSLQDKKGVSNYRIYKDLGLHAGNVNAFLRNCDTKRLSLDTVKDIWIYLKENEIRAS